MILAVIILVLLIVILYIVQHPRVATVQETTAPREVLITPENVSEIMAGLTDKNTDKAYTTSMNIDWYFSDGLTASNNAYIENPVENSRTVYFEVKLASTSEVVYSSPYIPVGSTLKNLTLSRDIDAGDYKAIVVYHLVDDDYKEVSTVSVSVNLHILN